MAISKTFLHSRSLIFVGVGCAEKWREVKYKTTTIVNSTDNTTLSTTATNGEWVDAPQVPPRFPL